MEKEEVKKDCCCGNCNHDENINENHTCNCGDNCTCGDNCNCGDECHCNDVDDNFDESEEVLILKNNVQNLEEKLKASTAELINYRKRKDEEVANKLKFANQDLIMDILPVLDNFERAIKLQKSDDPSLSKFLDGFKMLYNTLSETLKRYGVEEIDCLGKEFDPNFQEAMLIEQDKESENNVVLEVLIKGYILKGRVIRPASVKVNKLD
jgi:molecular chaperone GrpE